ncbi:MAG TPA: WD40 repeat domain-containing protein [Anaerolineales bacterium]|nr:WD40 repeat domain-containing protein [Anaerolineales bacterium]
MLSRKMAGFVCLFMVLVSSCAPRNPDQDLEIITPQATPELPAVTATLTVPVPSATVTPPPTAIPIDAINPENLDQVRLIHEYWLIVANALNLDPYEMDISAVTASSDGQWLAVGGCSHALEGDLRSGNLYCNSADIQNPDGVPFLVILDTDAESVISILPENQPQTTVADLAFSRDGEKLIYAIQPSKIALWDMASQTMESTLWDGDTSAPRITVSPDGKLIALKTTDLVRIWDASNKQFVAEIPAYFRPQFSADGGRILVYADQEFIIYETSTWTEQVRFSSPCDCVYAFSPDLSLMATSERMPAEKAPVLVWDISTGEQIQSLPVTRGFTEILSFTPDGQMLWRVEQRGDLMAWDTRDWQFLASHIGGLVPILNLHGFQFEDDGRHYLLYSDLHLGLYGPR